METLPDPRVSVSTHSSQSDLHGQIAYSVPLYIYNTKIDEFVCTPSISQTVAVRIMKLAHRPRIASTTIKLISKPIWLSILSFLFKVTMRSFPR